MDDVNETTLELNTQDDSLAPIYNPYALTKEQKKEAEQQNLRYMRQTILIQLLPKFEGYDSVSVVKHARILEDYLLNG